MKGEQVILVNHNDDVIGAQEKLQAHQEGSLHRAFSVFIFNSDGEMLLQQRAFDKYHSGGLWSNACCSHPRPGEPLTEAVTRRLREELGIVCKTRKAFEFVYEAYLDNGLIEHEFDHVFVGYYDGLVKPNRTEIAAHKWFEPVAVAMDLAANPNKYTPWFRIALRQILQVINVAKFETVSL